MALIVPLGLIISESPPCGFPPSLFHSLPLLYFRLASTLLVIRQRGPFGQYSSPLPRITVLSPRCSCSFVCCNPLSRTGKACSYLPIDDFIGARIIESAHNFMSPYFYFLSIQPPCIFMGRKGRSRPRIGSGRDDELRPFRKQALEMRGGRPKRTNRSCAAIYRASFSLKPHSIIQRAHGVTI